MDYAFYYLDNNIVYLQVGLTSKNEAKEGLENIASIFCKSKEKLANGRLDIVRDRKVKVLETYRIKYENGNVRLGEK